MPVFRAWWLGSQTSNAGSWMQQVAAAWLMYEATRSPAMVGVLGLAQRGPSLLLTPLGGRLADRHDRRRVLAANLALQLVAAAGLTLMARSGGASPTALIAFSAATGIGQALMWPSQMATISSLVSREALPAAVSLNSAGFNLSRVIGPAVAGLLLDLGQPTICFAANALSFVAPLWIAVAVLPAASAGTRSSTATVRGALRHVAGSPALRRLLVGCAVFTLSAAPLTVLTPPYAHAVGGGADVLGYLLAAFGAGAVGGATLVVAGGRRLGRARLIPAAMAAFAVLDVAAALAPGPLVAAVVCALAGICWLLVFSSTNAAVQLLTSDIVRGRVLALYLWTLIGPMAISGIAVGGLAEVVGIRTAFAACALPLGIYAVYALLRPVHAIDEGIDA